MERENLDVAIGAQVQRVRDMFIIYNKGCKIIITRFKYAGLLGIPAMRCSCDDMTSSNTCKQNNGQE